MQASLLDGSTVDLVAGGWSKMITPELRDTYLMKCQQLQLASLEQYLSAMKQGFEDVITRNSSHILPAMQIEKLVSGSDFVNFI